MTLFLPTAAVQLAPTLAEPLMQLALFTGAPLPPFDREYIDFKTSMIPEEDSLRELLFYRLTVS